MALVLRVLLVSCLIYYKSVIGSSECKSPQYVEIYSVGVIQCSFGEDVFYVLWYNSTNTFGKSPILAIENSVKSGYGYARGEFDIFANGSLIINNVSISHEGTYTAIKVATRTSETELYTVRVLVVAHTFIGLPLIDNCDYTNEICFQSLDKNPEVSCTVNDARSPMSLKWMVRTVDGDRNISSHLVITNETSYFFTSRSTVINPFAYSTMLTLLVCKANDPSSLLVKDESLVLIQKSNGTANIVKRKQLFLEEDSYVELNCSENNVLFLVWQVKQSPENGFEDILYAVFDGLNFTHIYNKNYNLHRNSSIVIDQVRVQYEGAYRCVSGNGFQDDVIMYDVVVFVYPQPPYVVVDGCDHQHYCVLEVQTEGSLTCTVKGIRPHVDLEFSDVWGHDLSPVNIYDKAITTRDNGDTFDVFLTSKYRFTGAAKSRVTVECKTIGRNIPELHLSSKFDLLFLQGIDTSTEESVSSNDQKYWIIAVVLALVLVILVAGGVLIVKGRDKIRYPADPIEALPMMSNSHDPPGKKDLFISELKAKYQDLYDAVQPIPYIRDRLYCVDRVFVEGGIEHLIAKDKIAGGGTWEKLSSYHNILDDDRVKSTRRIIEGEPGYGKSTLTLQLSYDWCNKIQQSYLKDTGILILLRLRQLGGVRSIYRAIKQFILPKDTKLTESDVADIISESTSVLVILDGYDEYPDQDDNTDRDVINIITRNMFQQFEVILTTRSSYLPKKYPALTKRLKLTGFDNNARDQYIRKAVVGDDNEAAEKIKQRLKENPVLGDLCQVPLFFVMFAHMSHESEQFQKFNSVTSFFRYMISCFHSHMKNKMEDENVPKFDLFEKDHKELDKLAFEGLSSKNQQIVWNKKDMCERLGQDFYDQYVRIGILVEEEVLDISDGPCSISGEHIQYKTEVRFYHKLFCEWYAAHHLSEYASRDDVTFDPYQDSDSDEESTGDEFFGQQEEIDDNQNDHFLKSVDPFDLQYVYRFTCGLNPIASEKIIGYLKTRKDANNFVILCILEKSGKVEDVLEDVKYLCSEQITISSDHSLLLQRSTTQLLGIALAHKISISSVYLSNCYSTVNLSGGNHLQLKSNLCIPVLTTLNELTIDTAGEGREITAEEFAGILQYSSKCLALKELRFGFCLLPQSVQAESVSVLRSRNVKVHWRPRGFGVPEHMNGLNLVSGLWQHVEYRGGSYHAVGEMTDDDYQSEVRQFREEKEEEETEEEDSS